MNSRPLRLAIDTGSAVNVLLPEHRFAFLGPSFSRPLVGVNDTKKEAIFRLQSLQAGHWKASDLEVVEQTSRNGLLQLRARKLDGFLSSPSLAKVCLQIDWDAKKWRLLDSYAKRDDDVTLPFKWVLDVPAVHARIGKYFDFIIDTGNQFGFSVPRTPREGLLEKGELREWRLPTSDGSGSKQRILVREVDLGAVKAETVPGVWGDLPTIGLGVLSRYRVTIDYPNQLLHLAPRTQPFQIDEPDASGIELLKDQHGFFAAQVLLETPAREAGLIDGDRLLALDGKPTDSMTFTFFQDTLSRGGRTVTLRVGRGSETFERKIPLRWPIEYPPRWPERSSPKKPIPLD